MLHLSVSYCKCRPPALVSMRTGRAKRGHRRLEEVQAAASGVGRRHRSRGAVVEEAGASLPGGLEEMGAAPVWKWRGESS